MVELKHRLAAISAALLLGAAFAGAQNLEETLWGTVPGLTVGAEQNSPSSYKSLNIRGANALKSSDSPLIIVDGTILAGMDNDIDNPFWEYGYATYTSGQTSFLGISVEDIESVEVLRNLSATALYGSQGAGGAIVIRTKLPERNYKGVELSSRYDSSYRMSSTNLSASGARNNTKYYVSGNFNRWDISSAESGTTGGFRINLDARNNRTIWVGLNAGASMGNGSVVSGHEDSFEEIRSSNSLYVRLNVGHHLYAKADLGVDFRSKKRFLWYGTDTSFGFDHNGAAGESSMLVFDTNASLLANWSGHFGKHFLEAEAKTGIISDKQGYNVLSGFDFFDKSLKAKGINIASTSSTIRRSKWDTSRLRSNVRLVYDYGGIAGADVALCLDNSSLLTGGYNFYPSGNAYLKAGPVKFKAGYGEAGNLTVIPYQWMGRYSTGYPAVDSELETFYTGESAQKSREWNAGAQVELFGGRLTADFCWYDKTTSDVTSLYCNGEEFGVHGFWKYSDYKEVYNESGKIVNKGYEISLSSELVRTEAIRWSISGNFSNNLNRIIEFNALDMTASPQNGSWTYSNVRGYSVGAIVGYDESEGTELINAKVLGRTVPKLSFGAGTEFTWKRLGFEAGFVGISGSQYVDFEHISKSYVTEEDIHDASYFIPSHITLSYDLPLKKMSAKASVSYAGHVPAYGFSGIAKKNGIVGGIRFNF